MGMRTDDGWRRHRGWTAAALFVVLVLPAAAQTRAPTDLQVQVWASSCMACHGPDGKAEGTGMHIAGKSVQELEGKLLGYKTGRVPGKVMHQHAKGYSDEELARLARFFSAIQ
jgi:cytochrome c553